jgi:hypothetical protein
MSIAVGRCRYGGTEPTVCFIKKKEDKIRGSGMICVPSSSKTYCVSDYDLFLKNTERRKGLLWLKDKTRKWLSAWGAVMGRRPCMSKFL